MLKKKSFKKQKFSFLLDAAFASPPTFIRLCKKTNLAHVYFDYNLSKQAEDIEIYELAVKENRFVITINYKDFRKLVKINKPGIFGIESQLTNEEIDIKITNFIQNKNPKDFIGKAIKV